jgi:hypothetical protein
MSQDRPAGKPGHCESCGAELKPQARFCHACGAQVGSAAVASSWSLQTLALIGAAVLAAAGGMAYLLVPATKPAAVQTSAPRPASSGPQAIDLSTMSPREAADRLFNRVMTADETGDAAQATQFAPMALQAYQRAEPLDADGHYHVGLLNLVQFDAGRVREEIRVQEKVSPNHLLALDLTYKLARHGGNEAEQTEVLVRYGASFDGEIASKRPEYEAHRVTIDKLLTLAKQRVGNTSSFAKPAAPAPK